MRLNRGYRYRERVRRSGVARTLLEHLSATYPHSCRDEWARRIRAGEVRVGAVPGRCDERVREGDEITWDRPPWEEPDVPRSFAILYRDEHVLAVAKPRGLPTVPAGGFLENTLLAVVRELDPLATPLHRLGRGTSGIVLFGRTKAARSGLARDWRDGKVERVYRGLVAGTPATREFTIDTPIGLVHHSILGAVHGASQRPGAKPARTDVRVVSSGSKTSVVELKIHTGRPDQIRIHVSSAGHPLVGDPLYGRGGVPRTDSRALPGDGGYWLHAARVAFTHPASQRQIFVECAPPARLRAASGGTRDSSGTRR